MVTVKIRWVVKIQKNISNIKTLTPNKWVKYKVLKNMKRLDHHLPATEKFSQQALWDFIEKYGTVILKPLLGYSGYGIIQVSALEKDRYVIQNENRKFIFDGKQSTFRQLKKMTRARKYLIQRRIPLAEIRNRPMDVRVMVQRTEQLPWKITGMLAKVAEHGYVVTNVSSFILPVKKAIEQSLMKPIPIQETIKKIEKVSLLAAKQLSSFYPSQNMIGLDIGLDHDGRVWIIEANFKPSLQPFLLLKKKSMYQRIKNF